MFRLLYQFSIRMVDLYQHKKVMAMLASDKFEIHTPAMMARLPILSRFAFDLAFTIAKWQLRSATRRSLRKLDTHLLHDIGLEPSMADCECTKRFWQD